jgi:uncharacterized membrane protein YphA (DoxX/SURF4 family)
MTLADLLAWLLACLFVWAGALNIIGPKFIRDEFDSWHYPPWLRLAAGAAEWLAAFLLVWPQFRLIGCIVGMVVLLGVILTLLRDRQLMRLEYPLVLLALAALIASSAAGLSTRW